MDQHNLIGGEDWDSAIRDSQERADFTVVFLSTKSTLKKGYFQKAFRRALEQQTARADGQLFLIPVRLDDVEIPASVNDLHVIDWQRGGWSKLVRFRFKQGGAMAKDFFVSYNSADKDWAEWIAWTLESVEYTTVIQAWDFRPGQNFVLEMQRAAADCKHTLMVLSPDYLASVFTQPEWAAAFAQDPTGEKRILIPLRVRPCELPGLFRTIIYCDLVGLAQEDAKTTLINAVQALERVKPDAQPAFPGTKPAYPASAEMVRPSCENAELLAAAEILDLLTTTWTTFVAQARIRNDLHETVRKRLEITEHLEYERFFQRFYPEMNEEELHLHKTVRAYTSNVLCEFNQRILDILQEHPGLLANVKLLPELKRHLIVWLAKFTGVFASTPSMCVVYVGVEEEVAFPKGVENELKKYIAMHTDDPA
jgi:hypothetical protein